MKKTVFQGGLIKSEIDLEDKFIRDRTINMSSLKTDFKVMYDLLERYFPKDKREEAGEFSEENSEEKPEKVTLKEIGIFYDRLPKEKKEIFLQELFEARVKGREEAKSKALAALPEDIKGIINMSQESWNKLPKNGQELILEKFIRLQKTK